ncbi:response regulator [filamentous cyanobacterium LEGE 11480]|uniref:histidine kinase n=1 Tax=Romeriopsis navalis LEGE 11480 TaxID=2777977 RepID=A0A928VMV8_9CYAN|nr:ATP-binding protein [Romeriopsis navalis]MBE9031528.1 response regulator [Romeriopsis navalis LEGE 11480]
MAASTVYLQAFQEMVAIGQLTDTVETIAQKFCETLSHRLLVLNDNQPTGVIYLPKLLPYLLSNHPQQVPISSIQPSLIDPLPLGIDHPTEITSTMSQDLAARNADLTQLNRLKDEFLACVTHELRSPLTAVLGLSTLLKDQSLGPLNDRQLRYARLIYNSGRHLISITNDMLDLTRIETNQLDMNFGTVNISQVCRNAFEQARQLRRLEDNHVPHQTPSNDLVKPLNPNLNSEDLDLPPFNLEVAPDLVNITADETRLRQMLVNLLSNAMKFTENDGSLGLRVNRWEGWIAFTVWDTGIGIPPDKQHLIFQKFQQLESTMTRQFEGTGLGLVLTMRLAHLHGGDITFTSQEHHGSQFTLLLPPEPPQSISQNHPPHPTTTSSRANSNNNPALASRLALVIDASSHNLEDLRAHLTELGYRIAVARSGPDALTKVRQLQPSVVFLNPVLPILSGWDVLTLLKANSQTKSIPVIVTGSNNDRSTAQQLQADDFLNFPILHHRLEALLEKLHSAIATERIHAHKPHVIIYLSPAEADADSTRTLKINHLLHQYNFRVLESHNLEQAELLAKVWKAQVVVLNQIPACPSSYLSQFIEQPYLASLPLITLDEATTQVANQMPDLAVFPCLVEWDNPTQRERTIRIAPEAFTENLLKAVEVAIGFAGRPLILATDVDQWQASPPNTRHDWLNALAQYVQAAGLRCSVGRSLTDILHTLETQSVDLLLLHWNQDQTALQQTIKSLKSLQAEQQRLPATILINSEENPNEIPTALRRTLDQLQITIVNSSESMDDLLSQIRQVLGIAN